MAKINEVLCKVLDIQVESSALNYYSLLQVPLYTSDAQQIGSALQAAAARVRAAAGVEPQATLEAVMKVLQQCNVTLMNPVKKAQYDQQLQAQLKKPAPAAAAASVAAPKMPPASVKPFDLLAEVLPPGNPSAEFSIKDFLNSSAAVEVAESVESRLAELDLLRGNYPVESNSQFNSSYMAPQLESSHAPTTEQEEPPSSLVIQKRIRRKRAVKNSMIVGTLFLIAAVLLGAAVWKYANPTRIVSNPGAQKAVEPRANATRTPATKTPQKSPSQGTDDNAVSDADTSNTDADPAIDSQSLPDLKTNKSDGQAFFSNAPSKESSSDNTMMNMAPDSPPPMAMAGFDQAVWDNQVKQIRESISRKDFDQFTALIQKLFEVQVETGPLTDLRQKIDRTGQLYKIGNEAFESGLKALKSGVTINTQDDAIGFIESTDDTVTFRIKGANKKFKKNELPEEILDALLKLELNANEAVNLAACGVFVKLYNSAGNYQKMAEKYLSDAAKKDPKYSQIDDLTDPAYHQQ